MVHRKNEGLKHFAKNVKKNYPDAKLILFGSRAGKDFLETSDYDIIIISKNFSGANFYERSSKMYEHWKEKEALDVFCYTPEEFIEKKQRIGFISEATKQSKEIPVN